jgi:protein subunit release factor B
MKQLLFSVTANDCDWSYYVGPGNGGQKKNKTHSGAMCTHKASGATARCHDGRSQLQNKQAAFRKMAETKEFKAWHRIEVAKHMGTYRDIEKSVDAEMKKIRVEATDENGRWIEIE